MLYIYIYTYIYEDYAFFFHLPYLPITKQVSHAKPRSAHCSDFKSWPLRTKIPPLSDPPTTFGRFFGEVLLIETLGKIVVFRLVMIVVMKHMITILLDSCVNYFSFIYYYLIYFDLP